MRAGRWLYAAVLLCYPGYGADNAGDLKRGFYIDAVVRSSLPVLEDPELTRWVSRIGNRVATASGNPRKYDFSFVVLNDPTPNALSAPGGFVYLTAGLLQVVETEDQLAAALAHEIAHVNSRHVMKLETSRKVAVAVQIGLSAGAAVGAIYATNAIYAAMGPSSYASQRIAQMVGHLLPLVTSSGGQMVLGLAVQGYGRHQEFEADELALKYLRDAEYQPAALAEILEALRDTAAPAKDNRWYRRLQEVLKRPE